MNAAEPHPDPDESREAVFVRSGPFWTRHMRREVQYLLDIAAIVTALIVAYLLRFDFSIPHPYSERILIQLPLVVLVQFGVLLLTGMYHFVWRYVGMAEVQAFLRGAVYSTVPLLLLRLGLPESYEFWRIPLSVILLDAVLAFGGMLGLRVLRRALYERYERQRRQSESRPSIVKPVLLVGAGRAGVLAAREIQGRGNMDLELVGFIDDDRQKQGSVIQGVKVLGTTDDLPELAAKLDIDHVVITIADADAATIRRIVEVCERTRLRVRIIPGLYEILQGQVSISRFRDLQIEDLLGRKSVRLDEEELRRFLTGKSVMVTGAGGSIGAELCRQIARFNPLKLLLVERAEGALFEIHRELEQLWPELDTVPLVADVGDEPRLRWLLVRHPTQVLLHSAAHKHVPLMEENPSEAIKNNVLATHCLGQLAGELELESFVLISTDKAVRPSSIMGASKRLAEQVVQTLDRRFPATRFLAVRFGNVMGSTGSVVPIFRKQIEMGGPVTVTHPEATRFFMTIAEAAQLVLQAGAMGEGGEIMILDMGEQIKILDLAKHMISLSGYEPFEEIPISFTGLRPGEKLTEELVLAEEEVDRTRHPKISVGQLRSLPDEEIVQMLGRLEDLAHSEREGALRAMLIELLPEADLECRSDSRSAPPAAPKVNA